MDANVKVPMQAVAVRYVHDAGSGECLNLGVVLLCADRGFVGARFLPSWVRITAAFHDADPAHLRRLCGAIEDACARWSNNQGGLLKLRDVALLVRQVIPDGDQGIAVSPVISGITADPERTLAELFARYVGHYDESSERISRGDEDVWRSVAVRVSPKLLGRLRPRTLVDPDSPTFRLEFRHTWKNAGVHAAQPVSLDLADPEQIQRKASMWLGNIYALQPGRHETTVHMMLGLPGADRPRQVRAAADGALNMLDKRLRGHSVEVLDEAGADKLAGQIERDLTEHPDDQTP